jgi:putative Mg2+ transporter-C (MgtC) family protein
VSTAIDPNELNVVIADLQRKAGVSYATWDISTTD